jgi:hypothetical protein
MGCCVKVQKFDCFVDDTILMLWETYLKSKVSDLGFTFSFGGGAEIKSFK